jgi:hypothetical protein
MLATHRGLALYYLHKTHSHSSTSGPTSVHGFHTVIHQLQDQLQSMGSILLRYVTYFCILCAAPRRVSRPAKGMWSLRNSSKLAARFGACFLYCGSEKRVKKKGEGKKKEKLEKKTSGGQCETGRQDLNNDVA